MSHQIGDLVEKCSKEVQDNGTRFEDLDHQTVVQIASLGWLIREIRRALGWPLWAVAAGLVSNALIQGGRFLLGLP